MSTPRLRSLAHLILLTAMVLLCACHPRWTVVRQASPSRIHSDTKFLVEPLRFDGTTIDGLPEAQWVASKSADLQKLWEESRATMVSTYVERVRGDAAVRTVDEGPLAPNVLAIRANVTMIEAGFFSGVVVKETEVRLEVQIVDDQGVVVDELRLRAVVPAGSTNSTIGGRVRSAANELAAATAKYIASRTTG